MRTTIEINDQLLAEAMAVSGLRTKKATVEEALRRLVLQHWQRQAIANLAGLGWDGDSERSRMNRNT